MRVVVFSQLVKVIQAMYEGVTQAVRLGEDESDAVPLRAGVHQCSC